MFRDLEGLVSITEATLEPRAGEVVVRVGATSLNYRDHAILMGWSPFPTKAGLVPVSDAAGVVEAVGEGVARFSVGDWVLSSFYPTWFGGARTPMFDFYGTERDGWLTEYKTVAAESLVAVPVVDPTDGAVRVVQNLVLNETVEPQLAESRPGRAA